MREQGEITTYFVTGGQSGFGGQNGVTGFTNQTGSPISGPFTYVNHGSVWAIKESGYSSYKNTYVNLSTGQNIYGLVESGIKVISVPYNENSIDLSTGKQLELFGGNSSGFDLRVIGVDYEGRTFSRSASIKITLPTVTNVKETIYEPK